MGLETVTYINDLNDAWPIGASDVKGQGDDHIRNIKKAIKASFPNINAAITADPAELNKLDGMTASQAELNFIVGVTSAIQAQLDSKSSTSHNHDSTYVNEGQAGAITAAMLVAALRAPVMLEEGSVSAQASKAFTSLITSAYKFYEIELYNLKVSNNGETVRLRLSTDNGSTWKQAGTSYRYAAPGLNSASSVSNLSSAGTDFIVLLNDPTSNANYSHTCTIKTIDPLTAATFRHFSFESSIHSNSTGAFTNQWARCEFRNADTPAAFNALLVYVASGTFTCDYVVRAWN